MKKRMLSLVLSAVLCVQCAPIALADADDSTSVFQPSNLEVSLEELRGDDEAAESLSGYAAEDVVQVIVELEDETGSDRAATLDRQETVLRGIAEITGDEELTPDFQYTVTVNGFSVKVPYGVLDEVAAIDGVEGVHLAACYQKPEDGLGLSAAADKALTSSEMVGGSSALKLGYDGTGMLVAVIDTGIDADHPAFAGALDEDGLALTTKDVSNMLGRLNAGRQYRGLTVEDVYYSDKIPFGFNYGDNSVDISHENDNAGDHGTHVAGILAANGEDSEVVGIAPAAQLIVMKVFGQNTEFASEAALVAAIEDAVTLGADVINLSLGGTIGFSQESTILAKAIQKAVGSGVIVCAATGNMVSSAYGNVTDLDLSLASNVDIGVISSPASLDGVLAVASVNSGLSYSEGFYVTLEDGSEAFVPFSDSGALYGIDLFSGLLGKNDHEDGVYEYVCVPGVGEEADYEGIDVTGKIALIQRGEITFAEKSDNAFRAGAVAAVVYNNTDESVNMDLSGVSSDNRNPCVFIEREDGALLVELAGEGGTGHLTVPGEIRQISTSGGGQPSSFSSWGALSDLTLKPDFSGVGGSVYSAMDGGTYGIMSGTSMATPQVSGAMLLLLQYLKEEKGITGVRGAEMARTLLMNTAVPAVQSDGVEYSPRKQGAGLINVESALSTDVYLTVSGNALPKVELGDDRGQSGVYTFNIALNNTSNEAHTFVSSASILTEWAENGYMLQWAREADADVSIAAPNGQQWYLYDLDESGVLDEADVSCLEELIADQAKLAVLEHYDLNEDGVTDTQDTALMAQALAGKCEMPKGLERVLVTVPAGGRVEVRVKISLTEEEKKTLKATFENGIYIEGYVTFDSYTGQEAALSVPMLVFFGDWTKAPLFETTYVAEMETELWDGTGGNCPVAFEIVTGNGNYHLGMNPVAIDKEYIPKRSNALNLTGEEGGVITDIYIDLLRNARDVSVEILSRSGRVLYRKNVTEVPKSSYSEQFGSMLPVIWSQIDGTFYFDPGEYGLKSGDELTIRITGRKDYTGSNVTETIEIPVYLDGGKPEILDVDVTREEDLSESCEVTITMRDDHYIAGVLLMTADGEYIAETYAVDQRKSGERVTLTLDVTETVALIGGEFVVGVMDYAQNMSLYTVNVLEEGEASLLAEDTMLAYGADSAGMGWSVLEVADSAVVTAGFWDYLGDVCAADAVGDTIFVVADDVVDALYAIDAATFRPEYTFDLGLEAYMDQVLDMAYCDEDGLLYLLVYTGLDYEILRVDLRRETTKLLTTIGGNATAHAGAYALACDADGVLYLIAGVEDRTSGKETAVLYTVDRADGTLDECCALGVELENSVVSAAMDQDAGILYFTSYSCVYDLNGRADTERRSALYSWDSTTENTKAVEVCDLGGFCYEALILTGAPKEVFDSEDDATAIALFTEEEHILATRQFQITVLEYHPWYVDAEGYELRYTSEDASVARVDGQGLVTAVGEGETTITVTASRKGAKTLTAVCRVVVRDDSVFSALCDGEWVQVSAGTMQVRSLEEQLITDADAAAYGLKAGPEGQDVVYVIAREEPPEEGDGRTCMLYVYDAESWELLECEAVKNRWELLGSAFPDKGFSDMAFDPYRCVLLAVSGRKCYAIDPVKRAVSQVYTVEACPEDCVLVGVTFDSAGNGWLVDSKGALYQITGYFGSFAVCHLTAEFGLRVSEADGASLEYDQLRDVLWFRSGPVMYAVDLEEKQLSAQRKGSLQGNVSCLFMERF